MTERPGPPELAITFFYYHDLDAALAFYTGVMGFPLAIDQGWSKILRLADGAHVGLVDESRGMKQATPDKPVQLCIRVPDVDAWYAYARSRDLRQPVGACSRTTRSASAPSSSTIPKATRSRCNPRRGRAHEQGIDRHQPELVGHRHRRHRRRDAARCAALASTIRCRDAGRGPARHRKPAAGRPDDCADAGAGRAAATRGAGLRHRLFRRSRPACPARPDRAAGARHPGGRGDDRPDSSASVLASSRFCPPRSRAICAAFGAMGVLDRCAGDRALGLGVAELADADRTLARDDRHRARRCATRMAPTC